MKTIHCPACKAVNEYEAENCAGCGEPLAMAKLQEAMAGIRETTARLQHQQAAAAPGGFSSINGFGTMLLDYRPRGDGTWDAVRWVTAAGIPLVPLGAYAIQPIHEQHTYGRHTASFSVLERPPLAAQRVARTYLLLIIGLLPLMVGLLTDVLDRTVGNGPAGFFVMLACGVWAAYIVFIRIKNDGKVYKPLPPRPVGG
jgi:hypothetical protein